MASPGTRNQQNMMGMGGGVNMIPPGNVPASNLLQTLTHVCVYDQTILKFFKNILCINNLFRLTNNLNKIWLLVKDR